MIGKLLSLLSTAKGVAAATVIATAGVTGGVVATNPDVQNAIGTAVQNVTQSVPDATPSPKASPSAQAKASASGQPAVVAARNAADKKLRDAFQDDQRTLEKLHSTQVQGADRAKLEDTVKEADAKLRARLTKALDEVAALTLGREGDRGSDEASDSPKPSGSPKASASARPSESAKASGSPSVAVAFTADAQVKIDAIVTAAITDMAAIVTGAQKAVAALPTFTPGKPSALPGAKPSDAPGGRPSDAPGGAPGARPTASATPTAHLQRRRTRHDEHPGAGGHRGVRREEQGAVAQVQRPPNSL